MVQMYLPEKVQLFETAISSHLGGKAVAPTNAVGIGAPVEHQKSWVPTEYVSATGIALPLRPVAPVLGLCITKPSAQYKKHSGVNIKKT
jgi:hypothetical protein